MESGRNTGKKVEKVFVGMSGGVDSSVSAALLQKEGYDVTGVFIKVWQPDWIKCSWKEERIEAMRAAAHLGIPFVTLDFEKEYKKDVIDYMIAEYSAGRTPNPDVMCNRHVKFGAFWKWAKGQGADFIATGHYARIARSKEQGDRSKEQRAGSKDQGDRSKEQGGELLAGTDPNKDQSYFLWTLNQDDLGHVLFPVGHLLKSEVRELARKFKLPNSEKKDSQGLCFIGKVDVKEFLSHYIEVKPGKVLNSEGKAIGEHNGALFYTIGERHGFTVTEKTPNDQPYYVISKDAVANTITVSNKNAADSLPKAKKEAEIGNVNWVSGRSPLTDNASASTFSLQARSRYRQPLQNVRIISASAKSAVVEFEKPEDTITPGQSLVVYEGDQCLGGGIIK